MPGPRTALSKCNRCGRDFLTWKYKLRNNEGKYCSIKCWHSVNDPVKYFWTKVVKGEGCWLWIGAKNKLGYGVFANGSRGASKQILAHRFSYELTFGSIPDNLYVCHSCDVPACVNPKHLFAGTAKDNAMDMVSKGRSLSGDKNPSRAKPENLRRGNQHPNAKLDYNQAQLIRENYETRGISKYRLALLFNVSKATINNIVAGKTWKFPDKESYVKSIRMD